MQDFVFIVGLKFCQSGMQRKGIAVIGAECIIASMAITLSLTEWAVIRIRISDGSVEEIKRFREENRPQDCIFLGHISKIPFSIYDDVLYYFVDCSDLSKKLKNMQKGYFYGVDPISDLVYIKEYTGFNELDKQVSVNVKNKIVEELTVLKLA